MFTNTLQLNANGFNWYNDVGTALGDKLPQPELWTQYAAMYRFYLIEHVELEFVPVRY